MPSDETNTQVRRDSELASESPDERWSGRLLLGWLLVGAATLVIGGVLGYGIAYRPGPDRSSSRPVAEGVAPARPPPPRASEAEREFLRPLAEGRRLGGFEVRELRPVDNGSLRIVCERDGARVKLDIALLGPESPSPPAMVGRYAIYYSLERASQADGERLARELEKILAANAAILPPPGLKPFRGEGRPPMEL